MCHLNINNNLTVGKEWITDNTYGTRCFHGQLWNQCMFRKFQITVPHIKLELSFESFSGGSPDPTRQEYIWLYINDSLVWFEASRYNKNKCEGSDYTRYSGTTITRFKTQSESYARILKIHNNLFCCVLLFVCMCGVFSVF